MKPEVKKVKTECGYYSQEGAKQKRPFSVEMMAEVKAEMVEANHGLEAYAGFAGFYLAASKMMEVQVTRPAQRRRMKQKQIAILQRLVTLAEARYADAAEWVDATKHVERQLTVLLNELEGIKTPADADTWRGARPHAVVQLARQTTQQAEEFAEEAFQELERYRNELAVASESVSDAALAKEQEAKKEAMKNAQIFSRSHDAFVKDLGPLMASANKAAGFYQGATEGKMIAKELKRRFKKGNLR